MHGMKKNSKVWKKFNGMKQFVQSMNFLKKGMEKFARYENIFKSMKYETKVWKKYFWVWKNVDFGKFPFSYPRLWKNWLFFPDDRELMRHLLAQNLVKKKKGICNRTVIEVGAHTPDERETDRQRGPSLSVCFCLIGSWHHSVIMTLGDFEDRERQWELRHLDDSCIHYNNVLLHLSISASLDAIHNTHIVR
jgi:hypothetical protein